MGAPGELTIVILGTKTGHIFLGYSLFHFSNQKLRKTIVYDGSMLSLVVHMKLQNQSTPLCMLKGQSLITYLYITGT